MTDDEEHVQVKAKVPRSVREGAKEKLEYGGLSREIRELLTRIAFGEDLNQRSRLERQRDEIQERIRDLREQRRELDTEIDNLEMRRESLNETLSNLTTREDKYEAKLESLEHRLLEEGERLDPGHGAVVEAANTAGIEPEGVVETLKERNPDVPPYAFQDALHDQRTWDGSRTLGHQRKRN